jgi:subfamily B ATP-binding cassette protein MsbA
MPIPGAGHVVALCRSEPGLSVRFLLTAVGRALLSALVVVLIQEFLSAAFGSNTGLQGLLAPAFGPQGVFWAVAVLLFLTQIGSSLLNYDNQVTQQRLGKALELGLMNRLVRHLLTLSVPFLDRQRPGDLLLAVRRDVEQMRVAIRTLSSILFEGCLALGLLATAVWINPTLAFWSLVVLPLAGLPVFLLAKRTLAHSHRLRLRAFVLFDLVLQILRGVRVIKVYRAEETQARLGEEHGRAYNDELIHMVRLRSAAQAALEALAGLSLIVVVILGGRLVMRGSLDWPALLAFLMAFRALYGPLQNISTSYVEAQTVGASAERIAELLRARPEVSDRPDALPLPAAPRRIAFEQVGFSYEAGSPSCGPNGAPVLTEVTFEAQAGETIGIVGPSGSGKSTLLSLLARFYDPTSGRINFDGRDTREFRLSDLYDQVAMVTQEPFLFATTVMENIRCGRPDATNVEVEAAARAAFLHDEILALPLGYETPVGVGGRELSGGQRQRLNVARALLKSSPILLLDEATSSLDSIAEAEVQGAIERLMTGRTSFVIAHRLSTLRNATRLLVLDGGRCVGFDTHQRLLADCPLYRRLWETQRLEEEAPNQALVLPQVPPEQDLTEAADTA